MNPLVVNRVLCLGSLFIFLGCSDIPNKKEEIPHCTCGIMQPALTLECEAHFELNNLKIKSIQETAFHDVQLRGIQRFHDSPLMNVGIDYEFDCKNEYIIVLNESEKYTFHIKGMKFAPVPYYSRGSLKYFCELSSFYANDTLTRYNSIFLRIANKD